MKILSYFSYFLTGVSTLVIYVERCFSLVSGRELSLAQQYAGVGALSFPLFWIAGAGSAVFWIIGK